MPDPFGMGRFFCPDDFQEPIQGLSGNRNNGFLWSRQGLPIPVRRNDDGRIGYPYH
ncbi:hypothetical protein EMIT0P176_10606 [Pseudomonas sp. IT-P176]|jgi:hypothetical protein